MRLNEELSREEFQVYKAEAERNLTVCKSKLEAGESKRDNWVNKAEEELSFIQGIIEKFNNGTIKEKKYIFSKIGSNYVLGDQKLAFLTDNAYLLFKEFEQVADYSLEPSNLGTTKPQKAIPEELFSIWQPLLDALGTANWSKINLDLDVFTSTFPDAFSIGAL